MAKTYWGLINTVLEEADIIIQVLDARFPKETRNPELEEKIAKTKKKMIFAINKTDLVSEEYRNKLEKMFKGTRFVLMTVKEHHGAQALRNEIKAASGGKVVTVGVCGYPNTGKSSVINALKGSHAASTSPKSGFTRSVQKIKIAGGNYVIDTPGVIQYKEDDETALALISAISKEHIKDPEVVAMKIIRMFLDANPDLFSKFYDVDLSSDDEVDILDEIAKKTRLLKGGKGDPVSAGRKIIADWQEGRLSLTKKSD